MFCARSDDLLPDAEKFVIAINLDYANGVGRRKMFQGVWGYGCAKVQLLAHESDLFDPRTSIYLLHPTYQYSSASRIDVAVCKKQCIAGFDSA